jgi:regulator of replication initiation timing
MTTAQPDPGELVIVQLTRMEGKLDRVIDRVSDLRTRVDAMESNVTELQVETQTLREGFQAEKEKAVALALALEKADQARRQKSETVWTPFARLATVLGVLMSGFMAYLVWKAGQ